MSQACAFQQLSQSASKQNHCHQGPKPKSIANQVLKASDLKPIQRVERTYSQKQKLCVLVFLWHHRIPVVPRVHDKYLRFKLELPEYQPPMQQEASELFQVPQKTVSNWVWQQQAIETVG